MAFLSNISQQTKLVGSFILIIILHIVFKLLFLDYSCFWYDETFGLYYSQQDWGLIKHTSEWDLNPPLYYYFLWIWRNLFGISEFAIRFSSVLFSSLAGGILYIFSLKNFNKTTALIALLIYTSSNEIFFYSHEARCYSILFFLTLSSSYFYFNLIEKKGISSIVLLGIFNFFLIYTHYLTGLILAFQALLVLIFYNKQFAKRIGVAFLITCVLSFWRFTKKTILLIFNHEKNFWLPKASLYNLKTTLYDFFNSRDIFLFYLILITATSIIIFVSKPKFVFKSNSVIKLLYILLCGVGTIIICYAIGVITPIFTKRYVIYAFPFICILIGLIVSRISNHKLKYIAAGLVCLMSLYSFTKIDFHTPKHMNYRDAMVYIKKEKTEGAVTLIQTKDMGALFAYYYDRNIFIDYKNLESDLNKNGIYLIYGAETLKTIDFTKYDKVILTQTFVKADSANNAFLKEIAAHYQNQTTTTSYQGIVINVFK